MYLEPLSFKRSSKKPFAFLFPRELTRLTVISYEVASVLEREGYPHIAIGNLAGEAGAASLHVQLEAPMDLPRCAECLAYLVNLKECPRPAERTRPFADAPIQLVYGTVVVSDEVVAALQGQIVSSAHAPVFELVTGLS
jgi:hypothetical protein